MINLENHKWKSFNDEFPDINNSEHATAIICMWRYEAEDFPEEYEYRTFNLGLEGDETILVSIDFNVTIRYNKYNLPDYEYWDYII